MIQLNLYWLFLYWSSYRTTFLKSSKTVVCVWLWEAIIPSDWERSTVIWKPKRKLQFFGSMLMPISTLPELAYRAMLTGCRYHSTSRNSLNTRWICLVSSGTPPCMNFNELYLFASFISMIINNFFTQAFSQTYRFRWIERCRPDGEVNSFVKIMN